MNIQKKIILAIFSLTIIVAACKKDRRTFPEPDVYISGWCPISNMNVACYWKNTEKVVVNDISGPSNAFDLVIDNEIVYLVGQFNDRPCYWKDGEVKYISSAVVTGRVNAIKISPDGQIYMVGKTKLLGNNFENAMLWKVNQEGVSTAFQLENTASKALDLDFKNDGTIVIAGQGMGSGYWLFDPSDGTHTWENMSGDRNSVVIINDNLYMSGNYTVDGDLKHGYFWGSTGGIFSWLKAEGAESITFAKVGVESAEKIYLVGQSNDLNPNFSYARVWLNGSKKQLSTGPSEAVDIAFSRNKDVYVAGKENTSACYWKNNTLISLNTGGSVGTGIFLVEK